MLQKGYPTQYYPVDHSTPEPPRFQLFSGLTPKQCSETDAETISASQPNAAPVLVFLF